MSIELVEKKSSDAEHPLLDEHHGKSEEEMEEIAKKKSIRSPQRKHKVDVVPFSVSLEAMRKVSKMIQEVNIFFIFRVQTHFYYKNIFS
jgi:hypothetical protein